jgi:potassium efflux system protein
MIFPRSIRQAAALLFTVVMLCASVTPLFAQFIPTGPASEGSPAEPWQPPDVTNLPLAWWDGLETTSPEQFQERTRQFGVLVQQEVLGLIGEEQLEAQVLMTRMKGQADLLILALRNPEPVVFDAIPTQEAYTLDELLALRQQWRDVQDQQKVPGLRIEELQRQSSLLGQSRDNLLEQYDATEANAPARILLGLQRVSARLENEVTNKGLSHQEQLLDALKKREDLLDNQLDYARTRLQGQETDWHAIDGEVATARAEASAAAVKLSSLQRQLLEVLSASEPKPSLELLRKQQLTLAAATQSLAEMKSSLDSARANWYRLHSGTLDPGFDINESIKASGDLVQEAQKQVEVWTAASQTTLISPLPDSGLNAQKNVELARSVAQETLGVINRIETGTDDLLLVQKILASDMVETQSGFRSIWTRLTLISGGVGESFSGVIDYDLFHIGDAPVTPGRIIKMLMIIVFGFLLSWTIRHLLDRLKNRRKYAKTSVVYTLGRILHYIIITAVFAALGTIGLDFTNFALIAGALSVGIGFGLQSIVNNFVSGLILLFEGSLRVGDYIELDGGLRGTVKEINTRATVINTNDAIDMVVPNSEFVTARLTNWTLRDPVGRLRVDFGVAYGSDKDVVREAALDAVSEVETILQHTPGRETQVRLVDFGDSSLDFQVLFWVSKLGLRRPGRTKADFLWILETKLREKDIEIPFPQRDLHLRTGFDPAR